MQTEQEDIEQGSLGHPLTKGKETDLPINYSEHELIEGLPGAIYICDAKGRITFYNQAAADLWGRKPELGKDLWYGAEKIFHTDGTILPLGKCPMAIALKEGRAMLGEEIVFERPDGKRVNVLSHPKPIFDSEGNLTGGISMLVDITEKKKTEEALRKSENENKLLAEDLETKVREQSLSLLKSEDRYHKMIEEVRDYAILLLDKEGNILNWNKGAEKIKGYTEKEALGKNFRIFYGEEDRKANLPERLIQQATEKGKATHEGWRLRKDGSRFWGSVVITAVHDDENNIIGFSKVTRDLTDKKMADDRLKQYAKDLESQNKELEQYAFIASHDLQEPLRKIQIYTDLLERNLNDETAVKQYFDKIRSSARRMANLVKDILKYARISNEDELFIPTDLNKIVENVIEDSDLLITQKNAIINHDNLPVVMGVPFQLQQLFSNLISNSIKFSDKDPVVEITSRALPGRDLEKYPFLNSNANYVEILFKDYGIGFEQKYADNIFKLFQRLNNDEYISGTGIGLTLCRKIVENHAGHIEALSEPGKGTTFRILLPAL